MNLKDSHLFDVLGIKVPLHRQIITDALPCGIESVCEAWQDQTPYQVNAPRALMVCHWKGMVTAFSKLEKSHADN